jgi:hypothetical protein
MLSTVSWDRLVIIKPLNTSEARSRLVVAGVVILNELPELDDPSTIHPPLARCHTHHILAWYFKKQ